MTFNIKYILVSAGLILGLTYYRGSLVRTVLAPFSSAQLPESLTSHFFDTHTAIDAHNNSIETV